MKYIPLILSTFILSSCINKNYNISDINHHMFSDDKRFIAENIVCESNYSTNIFDSVSNEIFRCSGDNGSLFIQLESTGNDLEHLKSAKLVWKKWHYADVLETDSKIIAQQYAAVFAKMFTNDNQIKFLESFINGQNSKFKAPTYSIVTSINEDYFYNIHKAVLTFK